MKTYLLIVKKLEQAYKQSVTDHIFRQQNSDTLISLISLTHKIAWVLQSTEHGVQEIFKSYCNQNTYTNYTVCII
jgi:hypothetical protein